MNLVNRTAAVEEHSAAGRSKTERTCGRSRRENAGISSESKVRILAVENLRVLGEGSSAQGKSGPKTRPKRRSRWTAGRNSCTEHILKDIIDTGEKNEPGRGKTGIARWSEINSSGSI